MAHLVFKVADLKTSCQFYSDLGLPPFFIEDKVAIIELRGGTHLLLLEVDQLAEEGIAESVTGQFHKRFSERFDLMIKGKGLNELKTYRSELISRGIAAKEIPDETFFGHHLFLHQGPRWQRHNDLHQPRNIVVRVRGGPVFLLLPARTSTKEPVPALQIFCKAGHHRPRARSAKMAQHTSKT